MPVFYSCIGQVVVFLYEFGKSYHVNFFKLINDNDNDLLRIIQ